MPRRRSSAIRKAQPQWDGVERLEPRDYLDQSERMRGFYQTHLKSAATLEIEVGSGTGDFLIQAAHARKNSRILGIEYAKKFVRYIRDRVEKEKLANVLLLCTDARAFVERCLPDASVDSVHVYFPDPWPKKAQQKRRFLSQRGIAEMERVLKPQGVLYFTSDYESYAQSVATLLQESKILNLVENRRAKLGDFYVAYEASTHFGDKYLKQGKPVYVVRAVKGPTTS